jgi:hypothetical protein
MNLAEPEIEIHMIVRQHARKAFDDLAHLNCVCDFSHGCLCNANCQFALQKAKARRHLDLVETPGLRASVVHSISIKLIAAEGG